MATVKDAPVLVSGNIFNVELLTLREARDGRAAGSPDGARVMILAGDGIAVVKVKPDALPGLSPYPGQSVAWYIRNAAYSVEGNSGMSTQFVRVLDFGDLDSLNSLLNAATAPVSSSSK